MLNANMCVANVKLAELSMPNIKQTVSQQRKMCCSSVGGHFIGPT